jgi:hypothetical protein
VFDSHNKEGAVAARKVKQVQVKTTGQTYAYYRDNHVLGLSE